MRPPGAAAELAARWFPFRRPPPAPRARLLCLPCAGGGASGFCEWSDLLPDVDVLAAQFPGRERRVREAPFRALPPLVEELRAALAALPPGPPLVVFGHSLGALVGFQLARTLAGPPVPQSPIAPRHLIAAAARAPHRPPRRLLHDLPLASLLDEVVRLGGTSPRVLAEPELVAVIEPALRADLLLAETNVLARSPPLPLPVTVLGGALDPHVADEDLEAWREVAPDCMFARVSGGHFFVRDARAEVLERVRAVLP